MNLAQQQVQKRPDWASIALWSGILMAAVVVGMIMVILVRRWLEPDEITLGDDFTLHGLRQMRDTGQMTEAEFERAREALIAKVKAPPGNGEEEDPAVKAVRALRGRSDKAGGGNA